jgi:hypothetical protein
VIRARRFGERVSPEERRRLYPMPTWLDCDRVRLHRGREPGVARAVWRTVLAVSRGRAVTLGNHVFLPAHRHDDLPLLAHELAHCGQYQAWGPARYFAQGLREQTQDLVHRLTGRGSCPYRYAPDGRPFAAYGMEQQGQIIEDAFRGVDAAWGICMTGADRGTGGRAAGNDEEGLRV